MSEKFGVEFLATVTFDYPTVHALAAHIAARTAPVSAAVPLPTAALDHHLMAEMSAGRTLAQLHAAVTELLGYEVQADQPLMEAGLDSIGVSESC